MTYIAASRDALTAAIHAATWPDGSTDGFPTSRVAKMIAYQLIASGAVIDASALADDQPLVYRAARWLYAAYDEDPDKDWPDESEHARTTWSNDARDAFRALAAALTERAQ
ncbi:MAG TPA: hypothetical protein VFH56_11120 [Acidimicrobiales bacterium]|nr:hypothetical protein [Acidimicrobiales bacterium]